MHNLMSAYGYKRTLREPGLYVRFWLLADIQGVSTLPANDPLRTFAASRVHGSQDLCSLRFCA